MMKQMMSGERGGKGDPNLTFRSKSAKANDAAAAPPPASTASSGQSSASALLLNPRPSLSSARFT